MIYGIARRQSCCHDDVSERACPHFNSANMLKMDRGSTYCLRALRMLVVIVMLVVLHSVVAAQQPRAAIVAARHINAQISIDGDLAEPIWQRAPLLNFTQQAPSHGAQPTEITLAWVTYDDDALYIAARLYDTIPSAITRNIGGRDADVPADWFEVSLDPAHDERSGYYFRVSAAGSMFDGTIANETSRSTAWNGNWSCAAAIDSLGWCVEIRIPFSQLWFPNRAEQVWGINLRRWIYRKRESIVLALAPPSVEGSTAYFADLVGLKNITPPTRFEIRPYAVSQLHLYEAASGDPLNVGRDYTVDAGADMTIGFGSGMTLNATFNPDFGQVEVDPAKINLSTYETTYPEKRTFFTQGSSLFSFGSGQVGEFFYSRRIGRVPQVEVQGSGYKQIPQRTRILGAAKFSGKMDENISLGLLTAVTARTFAVVDSAGIRSDVEVEPLAFYGAARDLRQFDGGHSGFGVFAAGVVRNIQTDVIADVMNKSAIAAGVDGWIYLDSGRAWVMRGLAGTSYVQGSQRQILRLQQLPQRYFQRPDASHLHIDSTATFLAGWTGRLVLAKQQGNLTGNLTLSATSPGFELNDIGILRRADRLLGSFTVNYNWYEPNALFLTRSIGMSMTRELDFSGSSLASTLSFYGDAQFANAWGGSISMTLQYPGIDVNSAQGGPSMSAPSGWSGSISMYTDDIAGLTFWSSASGYADNGDALSLGYGGGVTWRPNTAIMISAGPWWDNGDWVTNFFSVEKDSLATSTFGARYIFSRLKQSSFSTEFRVSWTATPRLGFQVYTQYYDSKARYGSFKELARPASFEFRDYAEAPATVSEQDGTYIIDPDGNGPAASFPLYNSDFDYSSLRGTAVLQWEYVPGSTFYLVWTRSYFVYEDFWTWQANPQPQNIFKVRPDDTFLVKVSYLLGG
jgi:hypothetical protein